jgi:hypothetical protein
MGFTHLKTGHKFCPKNDRIQILNGHCIALGVYFISDNCFRSFSIGYKLLTEYYLVFMLLSKINVTEISYWSCNNRTREQKFIQGQGDETALTVVNRLTLEMPVGPTTNYLYVIVVRQLIPQLFDDCTCTTILFPRFHVHVLHKKKS